MAGTPNTPYRLLACDYDGTIAHQGVIAAEAGQALSEAKQAGLLLALVTGRAFEDLLRACSQLEWFDLVVAENGAVLYLPAPGTVEDLAPRPPERLIAALARWGVPVSPGRVVIGIPGDAAGTARELIRAHGLDMQIIFNKGAAMILPRGVDKGSGLHTGLARLGVAPEAAIGVGDAENDQALLAAVGLKVAVANALDSLKARADLVTRRPNGAGVAELIREHLLGTSSG
jgi:hydroxymethylpyrimidine pyrophosphatase-like HAD family hydrolase